jgi:transcriptional regulator EpsA
MLQKNNIQIEKRDRLLAVIQRSLTINRHVEFFRWLQDEVRDFLPHDVLIAAWGDFSSGKIEYDVASSIPEVRTQKITVGCDIDPLIGALYYRWLDFGEQWYALNNFDILGTKQNDGQSSILAALVRMQSLVVHGIRDKRSRSDCLYVFFDHAASIEIDHALMNLLLPHIDAALRRVERLEPTPEILALRAKPMMGMSQREHEIVSWVSLGKTNEEIGMILTISPNTVKNHLKRIFQKLDVTSRAQVAAKYQTN